MFLLCITDYVDWYSEIPDSPNSHQIEENVQLFKEIAIHSNNVLKDMIVEFKDEAILSCCFEIVFIDDRGRVEEGRGSDIKIEALSTFCMERILHSSRAIGASEKVPAIRHDYHKRNEWQSIALNLVSGFTKIGYFPIALCCKYGLRRECSM